MHAEAPVWLWYWPGSQPKHCTDADALEKKPALHTMHSPAGLAKDPTGQGLNGGRSAAHLMCHPRANAWDVHCTTTVLVVNMRLSALKSWR